MGRPTVVQPVQVMPRKIKGKLHSALGSGPDVVEQVEVLMEIPEVIANERWRNNGKSIVININLDQWGRRNDNSPRL